MSTKLFLCGGGADHQTTEVNRVYAGMTDPNKPVLYIPLAMETDHYEGCLSWVKGELAPYGIDKVEMADSSEAFPDSLDGYSSIYIGGGNTFRLLEIMKSGTMFGKIREYAENGGIIMGGSAGAIIFGRDISCCSYADINKVQLEDTSGFDLLNGWQICCHYTNQTEKRNAEEYEIIMGFSRAGDRLAALPEDTHLFVEDQEALVIGKSPCSIFEHGTVRQVNPGEKIRFIQSSK